MNFTKDVYGLKACLCLFGIIAILMFVADFIGLDVGMGGTPFKLFE